MHHSHYFHTLYTPPFPIHTHAITHSHTHFTHHTAHRWRPYPLNSISRGGEEGEQTLRRHRRNAPSARSRLPNRPEPPRGHQALQLSRCHGSLTNSDEAKQAYLAFGKPYLAWPTWFRLSGSRTPGDQFNGLHPHPGSTSRPCSAHLPDAPSRVPPGDPHRAGLPTGRYRPLARCPSSFPFSRGSMGAVFKDALHKGA
jgi:hypothetical protein